MLAGHGLSGGSPQGIREEVADQEGRIRQAIGTWPLAPLSASLSGYREVYDESWRMPLESALRRTSCSARPAAPLIDASWWRRIAGPGRIAAA